MRLTRKTYLIITSAIIILLIGLGLFFFLQNNYFNPNWEIEDKLDGNIFPSAILSSATTSKTVGAIPDSSMLGNPKSPIAIRIRNVNKNSLIRIEIDETPFFNKTITEIRLPKSDYNYLVYPDILWKYDRLKFTKQAEPVDISAHVELQGHSLGYKRRSFSMRSINECLLGYKDKQNKYHSTRLNLAAYVNEEHPIIDQVLKEALAGQVVKRFTGYQMRNPKRVRKQVFALWFALQKRGFKYSSLTNTSLSSNIVYTQRVRTIDDIFEAEQMNCVDGSVLFASLLRAIGIDPILVRIPGHMFIGFYLDHKHKSRIFLETTMLGEIDMDEFFNGEQLDTKKKKELKAASFKSFNKAVDNANNRYLENKDKFKNNNNPNYMYLEINKELRRFVQPIGK